MTRFFDTMAHCRLCWWITGAVFAAILAIETVLLLFSVNLFVDRQLLAIEHDGRLVVATLLAGDPPADRIVQGFAGLADTRLRGLEIRDAAGRRLAGHGEQPTGGQVAAGVIQRHYSAELARLDVRWPAGEFGPPFALAVRLDTSDLPAQTVAYIWRIIGLVVVITFFVTAVTMLILDRLVLSPLRSLREQVLAAALDPSRAGQVRAPVWRNDELGDVTGAFNQLTARLGTAFLEIRHQQAELERHNSTLEQQVAERTAELEQVVKRLRREAVERERAEQTISTLLEYPDSNPEPVLRLSRTGEILYRNRAGDPLVSHWLIDGKPRLPAEWCRIVADVDRTGHEARLEATVGDRMLSMVFHRTAEEGQVMAFGHDISERKAAEKRLNDIAYTDTLTGLPNRVLFTDRAQQAIRQARRRRHGSAIHLVDLDDFKRINEGIGHAAGDVVLQTVAERLARLVRGSDTVARLGSDEFAIVQTDVDDGDQAALLAGKVIEQITRPIVFEQDSLQVDCSIGITLLPDDGDQVEELLRNAELAMRRAKQNRTASFHFFTAELHEAVTSRFEIEHDLRLALERGGLELHYQPKVELHRDRIGAVEALLRWRDPQRGWISPGVFIPIAESTRLIIPLGEWVLAEGCRQARAWQAAGLGPLTVALNLSAVQLRQTRIVDTLRRILLETGCDPHCVELELTESAVMDDVEQAIGTLRALRDLGVSLAIDDFGTGYSSLAYLKRFPVNRVKIDKAFVDGIVSSVRDRAIVDSVIKLGHSLGMQVTAEGVENEQQLRFLRDHGCDEIQGFYLYRPLPVDEVTRLFPTALPSVA